ncbi:MAG: hypothetical protein L0027_01920 [Candidatus Rokubacteria bacterium]|nr:hypothetical protein [Candidatus Rokubacteria bacterium]
MAGSEPSPGLRCQPIEPPADAARELFRYAGAWAPPASAGEAAWGAWRGEQLVGALLLERAQGSGRPSGMLHGPVVIGDGEPEAAAPASPPALETAAALVSLAIDFAGTERIETLFARPQALDRLWVRFGFIPVPEVELPAAFAGRPGVGLHGWRGGTALWSSGRHATPAALKR